MAIRSGFFNSVNGDRKYDANRFAEYFATFIGNGVFPNPSDNLQVIANDDMTVTVKLGKVWINGYILINDDDYILNIEPADGVLNRIDRVVARYDVARREVFLEVKQGSFASSPVSPSLQRDADAYELALADIAVNNGVISITQANITDLRLDGELCGVVHGTVDQVDTTTIFNQYQAWFNSITDGTEQEIADWQQQQYDAFMIWFQSIQDILEGDVAANLASRISILENDFTSHLAESATQAHLPKNVGLSNVDNVKQMPISNGVLENYREKLVTLSGTSTAINLSLGNVFTHTLTGNTTYSITNAVNSQAHSFTLIITQTATVRTLTFPASVIWQGEEIPDMTSASKTYVLTFVTVDGGTTWLGMSGGEFLRDGAGLEPETE